MAKKILIIEDEENVVELLSVNLKSRGYEIDFAESGEGGINKAFKNPPDIVLLNVKLPGIDGWEVCRILKEKAETKTAKIIFLTAAAQKYDEDKAKELGAYYMKKPFDLHDLIEIVESGQKSYK